MESIFPKRITKKIANIASLIPTIFKLTHYRILQKENVYLSPEIMNIRISRRTILEVRRGCDLLIPGNFT